ncbi:hypothetical protein PF005_g24282, partial [Phytophthora fragariae]
MDATRDYAATVPPDIGHRLSEAICGWQDHGMASPGNAAAAFSSPRYTRTQATTGSSKSAARGAALSTGSKYTSLGTIRMRFDSTLPGGSPGRGTPKGTTGKCAGVRMR